jgi:hypothetical protein
MHNLPTEVGPMPRLRGCAIGSRDSRGKDDSTDGIAEVVCSCAVHLTTSIAFGYANRGKVAHSGNLRQEKASVSLSSHEVATKTHLNVVWGLELFQRW